MSFTNVKAEISEISCMIHYGQAMGKLKERMIDFNSLLDFQFQLFLAVLFDLTLHLNASGGSYSKAEIPSSNMLLRPLMRYFGDREERHGAKLLKEIKAMFENMTKVFMDIKNVSISLQCHC